MLKFVYGLLYSPSGDFLIFRNREKSYFFGNPSSGRVYRNGRRIIVAPGQFIFPGGLLKGGWNADRITAAVYQHIRDKCGRLIDFHASDPGGLSFDAEIVEFGDSKNNKIAVCFIELGQDDLHALEHYISTRSLSHADDAGKAIGQGRISNYDQIGDHFPMAPCDNHFAGVEVWNIAQDNGRIAALRSDPMMERTHAILEHLKTRATGGT